MLNSLPSVVARRAREKRTAVQVTMVRWLAHQCSMVQVNLVRRLAHQCNVVQVILVTTLVLSTPGLLQRMADADIPTEPYEDPTYRILHCVHVRSCTSIAVAKVVMDLSAVADCR